jgi:acyl-CoA synthetase (NDP forming)
MLFLETMRNTEALRRFALAAHERGKPILAYKLGRSEAARELAVSHTGALAGEDDVADAFLADCGIARVTTLDGLIEGLPLLMRMPVSTSRRANVGVVTTTGGGATMVVDPLSTAGVAVTQPSAETLARFKAAGIDVKPARIVDVTLAGARYDVMKAALDILTTAPEYDLIVPVIGSSARFHPELAVKPIVDSANAEKPIAACLVPDAPDALAMLAEAGVPAFRTPEACADAVAAALRRRAPRPPSPSWPSLSRSSTSSPQRLKEDVDARHKAGHDESRGRMLDEIDAGTLIERFGIPRAPAVVVDAAMTRAPSQPISNPVVVKALSAELAHKTEAGGVVLNVADGDALLAAIKQIRANVAQRMPDTRDLRMLVQPMVAGLGEALIGYRVDPAAGPLVMVAAGGILTEIYRDRSLRLAPIDLATAQEMIGEVRAFKALAGFRGRPKGDLEALAQAIVSMSQMATDPSITEAEINPVIVRADGVVAVDALVKLA